MSAVRPAAPYLYLLVPNQSCRVSVNTSPTNMGKMPNKRVQMNQNFELSSNWERNRFGKNDYGNLPNLTPDNDFIFSLNNKSADEVWLYFTVTLSTTMNEFPQFGKTLASMSRWELRMCKTQELSFPAFPSQELGWLAYTHSAVVPSLCRVQQCGYLDNRYVG